MDSILRCKVWVQRVTQDKEADGNTASETVELRAVYDNSPENKEWSKWTPSAEFRLQINNPNAFGKLAKGHEFYLDFTPCGKS